ncbi:GMC family oxidoreductase N-terminal domain-containing protein, partial [bacterium]|nr:GMC family oxidoreductase N-terminal domain-containing protein [bacterium]
MTDEDFIGGVPGDHEISTDVVVVGTGAGGATVAKELSEKGVNVVMLEMGAFHTHEDFNQREDKMMPLLFQKGGATGNKDLSVLVLMGKGVGGSTVHNGCLCYRPPRGILNRWQKEYGVEGLDDKTLLPYFRRAEKNIAVSPVPEELLNENNKILRRGAEKLGWRGHRTRHNRIQCVSCGYCTLACAYNRKQSMLITNVPKALSRGAKLFPNVKAEEILRDANGATGLVGTRYDAFGRPNGRLRVNAKRVVVSAGSVQSAALMLRNGLGGGLIGRTLHIHPAAPIGAEFEQEVIAWRGTPQTWISDHFASFYKDGYGGFMIIPQSGHPGLTATLLPGVGAQFAKAMKRYPYIAAASGMIHDETNGIVEYDEERGFTIDYWPDEQDARTLTESAKRCAELYLAAGAKRVFLPTPQPVWITKKSEL